MDTKQEEANYERARKKVRDLKGLYIHIAIAIILIPAFIYINYIIDGFNGFVWFWFPIGGIIISLILHYVTVFRTGSDWEARKMKQFMDNENF